jgi:hypothetical protein
LVSGLKLAAGYRASGLFLWPDWDIASSRLLLCNLVHSPIVSMPVETNRQGIFTGAGASRRDVLGAATTERVRNRVANAPVVVNSAWKTLERVARGLEAVENRSKRSSDADSFSAPRAFWPVGAYVACDDPSVVFVFDSDARWFSVPLLQNSHENAGRAVKIAPASDDLPIGPSRLSA